MRLRSVATGARTTRSVRLPVRGENNVGIHLPASPHVAELIQFLEPRRLPVGVVLPGAGKFRLFGGEFLNDVLNLRLRKLGLVRAHGGPEQSRHANAMLSARMGILLSV